MWSLDKRPSSSLGVNVNNLVFLGRNHGVKSRQQHYTAHFSVLISILMQSQWDYRKLCPIMFQNNGITAKERHQAWTCQADSFPTSAWAKTSRSKHPQILRWAEPMGRSAWCDFFLVFLYVCNLIFARITFWAPGVPWHICQSPELLPEHWVPAAPWGGVGAGNWSISSCLQSWSLLWRYKLTFNDVWIKMCVYISMDSFCACFTALTSSSWGVTKW